MCGPLEDIVEEVGAFLPLLCCIVVNILLAERHAPNQNIPYSHLFLR
jgi:hypothetical protein